MPEDENPELSSVLSENENPELSSVLSENAVPLCRRMKTRNSVPLCRRMRTRNSVLFCRRMWARTVDLWISLIISWRKHWQRIDNQGLPIRCQHFPHNIISTRLTHNPTVSTTIRQYTLPGKGFHPFNPDKDAFLDLPSKTRCIFDGRNRTLHVGSTDYWQASNYKYLHHVTHSIILCYNVLHKN